MMWQIWLDDELYGTYEDKWKAELILDMLDITYPKRKKEIRICQ